MTTPCSIRPTSNWRMVTCGFRRSAARRSVIGSWVKAKASTGRPWIAGLSSVAAGMPSAASLKEMLRSPSVLAGLTRRLSGA